MERYEIFSVRMKRENGELDIFKYDKIPKEMRTQAFLLVSEFWAGIDCYFGRSVYSDKFWENTKSFLGMALGNKELYKAQKDFAKNSLELFLDNCSDKNAFDTIEVMFRFLISSPQDFHINHDDWKEPIDEAVNDLNYCFRTHALGYEFINGYLIRKDSQYLHAETVKPALILLHDKLFATAEKEFLTACEHRCANRYGDCIINASNAFESVVKIICKEMKYQKPKKLKESVGLYLSLLKENQFYPTYLDNHFDNFISTLEKGLPNVRNHNGSHGTGSDVSETDAVMADYALHLAATDIVFLVDLFKQKTKQP